MIDDAIITVSVWVKIWKLKEVLLCWKDIFTASYTGWSWCQGRKVLPAGWWWRASGWWFQEEKTEFLSIGNVGFAEQPSARQSSRQSSTLMENTGWLRWRTHTGVNRVRSLFLSTSSGPGWNIWQRLLPSGNIPNRLTRKRKSCLKASERWVLGKVLNGCCHLRKYSEAVPPALVEHKLKKWKGKI